MSIMDARNRSILIVGENGRRLDIDNPALTDWTVHLAPDFETARRHLSQHGSIDIVAVPRDEQDGYRAFIEHCTRTYPRLTSLLVMPGDSGGSNAMEEATEFPRHVSGTAERLPLSTPGNITAIPIDSPPERLESALRQLAQASTSHSLDILPSASTGRSAPVDKPCGNKPPGSPPHGTERSGEGVLEHPTSQEIRFKEDWVKVVAHDIRSPLTLINTYATMLLRDGFENEAQARMIVERMRNSGQWMMALVDNILDLALLEEGRLELKYEPHTLGAMLSRACENMRSLAEYAQVELTWEAPTDDVAHLVDHLKVEQVLQNLIGNSLKHSPQGSRVLLRGSVEQGRLLFSVRDWGRGMSPEQMGRIFDRFSSSATSPGDGRGLGLTIANTIVRLHGGEFQVDSAEGQGATFTFTIRPKPGASGSGGST